MTYVGSDKALLLNLAFCKWVVSPFSKYSLLSYGRVSIVLLNVTNHLIFLTSKAYFFVEPEPHTYILAVLRFTYLLKALEEVKY